MYHKFTFLLFFSFVLNTSSFAQYNSEETKIINQLDESFKDFASRPLSEVAEKYWILDDKTVLSVTLRDGTHIQYNAEQMLEKTAKPPDDHAETTHQDFKIKIDGNMAFSTCHRKTIVKESPDTPIYFFELRVLEKVEGVWKTHIASFHEYTKG